MKAITIVKDGDGQKAELQEVPLPKLRDDYLICRVKAVGLNPTDWKHIDGDGGIPGSRLSGIIETVGPRVTKGWKEGDRIAAFVHGGNDTHPDDGAFAEYCLAKGDLGLKVPDNISNEEAAGFGIPVITCGQALYQGLGLPLPNAKPYGGYILIYGGSTAVGIFAIQYAVLSGCKVIATASPRNFDLLKSLGAEEVFDYKSPSCADEIRSYTDDSLTLALDCISEGSSPTICEQSLSSKGGTITFLLKSAKDLVTRPDVERKHTSGYTVFGEAFHKLGQDVAAKPEDFEHAKEFWRLTQSLFEEGKLRPHPVRVGEGGLEGVFEGMQEMREGRVSGVKLVYRVGDTPGVGA